MSLSKHILGKILNTYNKVFFDHIESAVCDKYGSLQQHRWQQFFFSSCVVLVLGQQ
jgi:hypothetical protein